MTDKVLLLIDGLNIVRRVYEAIQEDDSPQKAEGALQSSRGSIQRALNNHKPTHFLAVFDAGGHTFRHDIYPQYKAGRKPMPDALRNALPGFLDSLNAEGLKATQVPGVEADDVIATLAIRAVSRGFTVIVLSTDKDLCALAEYGVLIIDHFKEILRDEAWIQDKHGVPSNKLRDYLALMGDASDNVPGIKGVGQKTAAQWIHQYGSLEGVLAAAKDIKGKLGDNLRSSIDVARLSQQLIQLKTDVDIQITPKELALHQNAPREQAPQPRRPRP